MTEDNATWELPAGRPEEGETLEETLRREVSEEACADVLRARLLGFSQGECIAGHETGLVLVRSFWHAEVALKPWQPEFETLHRRLVSRAQVVAALNLDGGLADIHARALFEADRGPSTWPLTSHVSPLHLQP